VILNDVADKLLHLLFPHLRSVRIDDVVATDRMIRFDATACARLAACSVCGQLSSRVHSRYQRRLADHALGGREVAIRLLVRRFRCLNTDCPQRIFAEQVDGLAERYQRRSPLLTTLLTKVGLALGGRPGARLTRQLAVAVSRSTLLRLIRATPVPEPGELREIGVDDFALRRGHVYGTVLIDMRTHRPVDLLPDRTADTLAAWLARHPGIRIVCRDRAGAYAEGTARGAPQAVQVADRWHLWHNLGEAVERAVARHRATLRPVSTSASTDTEATTTTAPLAPTPVGSKPPTVEERADRTARRTRDRHRHVHDLLSQGVSLRSIATQLRLSRGTVRRFARATDPNQLLVHNGTGYRTSILEEYKPYLHQRWDHGCRNATHLYTELTARGYTGGATIVRDYLRQLRTATPRTPPTTPAPSAPSVRQATSWLMTNPDHLDTERSAQLDAILNHSAELTTLADHVRRFAHMICHQAGTLLAEWITSAKATSISELRSFVTGLERDFDAVLAALTLPYSSGAVEGQVNRIKTIKRQMYGRANFDLLRIRVLHRP
jgi:transposase